MHFTLSQSGRWLPMSHNADLPLALVRGARRPFIGTLSFPVSGRRHCPMSNNSDIIAAIVRQRQPGLLLCAGWSLASEADLARVIAATRQTNTVVVLETLSPKIYWKVQAGRRQNLGAQIFGFRKETNKDSSCLTELTEALHKRVFTFLGRKVILLICGEINVVQGRTEVALHRHVPDHLRDALSANRVLILNPTHTRMGNDGTIKEQRKFLSAGGCMYVSASNWDLDPKKGKRTQYPSLTLHSLWHNGKPKDFVPFCREKKDDCFVYREWSLSAQRTNLLNR